MNDHHEFSSRCQATVAVLMPSPNASTANAPLQANQATQEKAMMARIGVGPAVIAQSGAFLPAPPAANTPVERTLTA
jgi:hypothetical protein